MLKSNDYMKAYLNVIAKSTLVKEDVDDHESNDNMREDLDDIMDELYDKGFDDAQPVEYIMLKLLNEAENDPQTVYNKVVEAIKQYDYVEQNDKGEYIITITCFADHIYTNFPSEVIQDPEFKEDYQHFSEWWEVIGIDGWCGYGDRGGVITDGEIIDKIYNLFNDFGDGSEEKPKIFYGDEDLDDDEFNDDDEEE